MEYYNQDNLLLLNQETGSHCTFRKEGCRPVTIPKHEPIKKVYVEMVKEVIESEVDTDDAE